MNTMNFSEAGKSEEPAIAVYDAVNNIIFDEDGTEHLERVSKEAKLIYVLCCFEGEIHNGGFASFFFNSSGDYTFDILEGLKYFEAESYNSCLRKAISWFPDKEPSKKREVRWNQMEPFEDDENFQSEMSEVESEFYKCRDNLIEKMDAYVTSNPQFSIMS
jgi:hypothetical protein